MRLPSRSLKETSGESSALRENFLVPIRVYSSAVRTPGSVETATKLKTTINRVAVEIDIEAVSEEVYAQAAKILRARLGDPNVKNRDAICETFLYTLYNCPGS